MTLQEGDTVVVEPPREQSISIVGLVLRPGDVVSVEHTPRTRANVFFDRVFRITLGLYVTPETFWND